jgi:multidrug efflux pump subunit AcrA (membrane-fusion protein)
MRKPAVIGNSWMKYPIREVTEAAIRATQAAHEQAQFAINTAQAEVERLEAVLVDLKLVASRSGRVQYKISQPGEVVGAGTRIITLLDLHDLYMTIYLPAAQAGQLASSSGTRLVAAPSPSETSKSSGREQTTLAGRLDRPEGMSKPAGARSSFVNR